MSIGKSRLTPATTLEELREVLTQVAATNPEVACRPGAIALRPTPEQAALAHLEDEAADLSTYIQMDGVARPVYISGTAAAWMLKRWPDPGQDPEDGAFILNWEARRLEANPTFAGLDANDLLEILDVAAPTPPYTEVLGQTLAPFLTEIAAALPEGARTLGALLQAEELEDNPLLPAQLKANMVLQRLHAVDVAKSLREDLESIARILPEEHTTVLRDAMSNTMPLLTVGEGASEALTEELLKSVAGIMERRFGVKRPPTA